MWIPLLSVGLSFLLTAAGEVRAEKLTLAESIDIALKNNPAVRISKENLRKADASIDEALAVGRPKLNLDATYQRLDEASAISFGGQSVSAGSLNSRTAELTLLYPIDVFGLTKTSKEAAVSGKAGFVHGYDQQTNDTILDTKTAFYGVFRAQAFLKVQEDTIKQIEAHLRDAQAQHAAGTLAKFEVLRAETQLANARQGLISARNGVELAKAAFNNVLGRSLDTNVDLLDSGGPQIIDVQLTACENSACRRRPEVLRAESLIQFSNRMAQIAELSSMPKVSLRWTYDRNFDTSGFNSRSSSWTAFLSLSVPLYDGGAARASVAKAESDVANARSMYDQTVRAAALDVQQAYLNMQEGRERISAAEKALAQAQESMRLAQLRYQGGISTQVEVLDAQTALTLAETNHVNAIYDYQLALAELERAVGGQTHWAKLLQNSAPEKRVN